MAETITLQATKREIIGKHVRHLRSEGKIPAVLYGPGFEPLSLTVDWLELRPKLRQAGGSKLINLDVEGDTFNVLVRNVQRRPVRGDVMHLDFYRVRMDVVIRTDIPIVLVGEGAVLEEAGGAYTHEKTSITVECLPGNLPASIEVNIDALQEVGDMVTVADLPELPGVTYHADPEEIIVTTSYLAAPEAEAEEAEEGAGRESEPELIRRREEEEEEE